MTWRGAGVLRRPFGRPGPGLAGFGGLAGVPASVASRAKSLRTRPGLPGYLPGVQQEWDGVVRRGAKLLHAFAQAVVPRVTLVTRKSYGGAYIAMNSRSLGATAVFAWPGAEVAVMGPEAAVGIIHRKALAAASEEERESLRARLTEEQRTVAGGVNRALALGVVDEVIDPASTRMRLARALGSAAAGRGHHTNIPL